MRKGVPQPSMSCSWMLKSSRDGPSLLSNLAMSPSVLSVLHHASNVRTADMSIIVCGPRSQRTNISQSAYKYSRRHGGRFCNSTALTSSSTARILSPKSSPKNTYTERRFKGEQRRVVKCSSLATLRCLTFTSTKHGRANNARNAALVSGAKLVNRIPWRTSFRNCVSMPSRWGKAAFSWGQSESGIPNMESTEKWNSRM